MHSDTIKLIYIGGTFGCHGTPLKPLSASLFFPKLLQQLPQFNSSIEIIDNDLIKDSSQFTLTDFLYIYQLVLTHYQLGYQKFILITGTDSLSYLGSFLAECFADSDILLNITASMMPLFEPLTLPLVIDKSSDAWNNFQGSIEHAQKKISGVYVCFFKNNWLAQTVKKQHSHDVDAFVGKSLSEETLTANYRCFSSKERQLWTSQRLSHITQLQNSVNNLAIANIFVMPNDVSVVEMQLQSLLMQKDKKIAIILLGFGSGNIPYSPSLAQLLDQAYHNQHMIVASTQCCFGGVSDGYASGSWQYEHHVLSGGALSIETIFACLFWIHVHYSCANSRREAWKKRIQQGELGFE